MNTDNGFDPNARVVFCYPLSTVKETRPGRGIGKCQVCKREVSLAPRTVEYGQKHTLVLYCIDCLEANIKLIPRLPLPEDIKRRALQKLSEARPLNEDDLDAPGTRQ